jgi:hypothetical protein
MLYLSCTSPQSGHYILLKGPHFVLLPCQDGSFANRVASTATFTPNGKSIVLSSISTSLEQVATSYYSSSSTTICISINIPTLQTTRLYYLFATKPPAAPKLLIHDHTSKRLTHSKLNYRQRRNLTLQCPRLLMVGPTRPFTITPPDEPSPPDIHPTLSRLPINTPTLKP